MSRRWIADTVLGLALTAVCAPQPHEAITVSWRARLAWPAAVYSSALIISFPMGLVCFTLMVWDPKERKSGRGRDTNE